MRACAAYCERNDVNGVRAHDALVALAKKQLHECASLFPAVDSQLNFKLNGILLTRKILYWRMARAHVTCLYKLISRLRCVMCYALRYRIH